MEVVTEYAAWLERLRATYDAVRFTCWHRIGDDNLGAQVAVHVVAGLIASPRVFRYQGLPFSGRVGTLAEPLIAEALAGQLAPARSFEGLRDALIALPPLMQQVLVLSCVHGRDDARVGTLLGCPELEAAGLRLAVLARLGEIAELAHVVPPPRDAELRDLR